MPYPNEELYRREEREAEEKLMLVSTIDDLRTQLTAARTLLVERAGLPVEQVNTLIAAKRLAQQKEARP